jgi:hypothetical protein
MRDAKPTSGTGCEMVHNKATLFWNQRRNKLTVPMGQNNVATFQLAPGYGKFTAFCAEAGVDYEKAQSDPIVVKSSQIISDDEDGDKHDEIGSPDPITTDWCEPVGAHFDLNGLHNHSRTRASHH